MKIASWNINSVRLRIESVKKFIEQENPDILALQETKVIDELFPITFFEDLGFKYNFFRGQKSYNGVAIFSKVPANLNSKLNVANIDDARHLSINLNNGIEFHNFYIPAGGDEPDININPKFKHKLDSLDYLHDWFLQNRSKQDKMIIVGDLNIAPYEHDVWSHKQLLNVVSHTPIEVEKLLKWQASLDFVDTARHLVPLDQKLYSWWSYRNKDWKKSNRGRRLDHIWVSNNLKSNIKHHQVHQHTRDWEKPSDHVPIVTKLISL